MPDLTTVLLRDGDSYILNLDGNVTVRDIARYFTRYEPRIDARTVELARPIVPGQTVRDLDWHGGDRLAIFTRTAIPQRLPARLQPGDKLLRFAHGDFEVRSQGRRGLLVGKPDALQRTIPDVDMRYVVSPRSLPFISRGCLWLNYDDNQRLWFASKLGETRVCVDEYELGVDRMPIGDACVLRFYRPQDDPRHLTSVPVGQLHVSVETIQAEDDLDYLATGTQRVRLWVGNETHVETVRAAPTLPLGQIMTRLAQHHDAPLTDDALAVVLRLLPMQTPVKALSLGRDAFLYLPRSLRYAHNAMILRNVITGETQSLQAADYDDAWLIGSRAHPDETPPDLDLDLYDLLPPYGRDHAALLRYQAHIFYRHIESTWYIRAAEGAQVPLYVNNRRVSNTLLMRLVSGDILTIGADTSDYFARLSLDITANTI